MPVDEQIRKRSAAALVFVLGLGGCAALQRGTTYEDAYARGKAAYAARDWDEAIAAYREAVRLTPHSAEAHNDLGAVLYDVGRREEAMQEYRRALRLDADYPEAHNNLGVALLSSGDVAGAVAEYRLALSLLPDFDEARYNLCLGLELLGSLAEALKHCTRVAESDPARPGVSAAVVRLQRKLGRVN